MKICRITSEIYELYAPFIPRKYKGYLEGSAYHFWGIYTPERTIGAVIFQFFDGNIEIVSLNYDPSYEIGEIEAFVTKTMEEVINLDAVYSIVYVVEGTQENLRIYDFAMMNAGYVPRNGEVEQYYSTLGSIKKKQKDYIAIAMEKLSRQKMVLGKELTHLQINKYNELNPENAYSGTEFNEELSMFLLDGHNPIGGILISDDEEGNVVFSWMYFDKKVRNITKMNLIYAVLLNALEKLSPDQKIIVCPFSTEVAGIVKSFGFKKETETNHNVRIYTKYL